MSSNCAFPGCSVQRKEKFQGTTIFTVPKRKDEFYTKWRKDLINIISRYRVLDCSTKQKLINCDETICICEKHFAPEDIEYTKSGRKALKLLSLPTINLPTKSQETPKVERREITRQSEVNVTQLKKDCYNSFEEVCKRITMLKLNEWCIDISTDTIKLTKFSTPYMVPHFKVIINESLAFTVIVFGWPLPVDHDIYKLNCRSIQNITISELLKSICSLSLCPGLHDVKSKDLVAHVIICEPDLQTESDIPIKTESYERSKTCNILLNQGGVCISCEKNSIKQKKVKQNLLKPAHRNAPLSKTNPERIILSLKQQRKENKDLQNKIKMMEREISSNSVIVDEELGLDFQKIMSENDKNITPFMKLFWEQQQKSFGKGTTVRYHPMIIRFCLSLASKSASAYDELRSSNVLTLPSRRTLRDYKNAIKPEAGFNPAVIQELIKVATPLNDYQRYIVLSFDEMKIEKNLVYDKYSGQLTGYVDLGDPDVNYSSFKDQNDLATHVLAYYVRGLASDLKFELGYFGTKDVTAHQIMLTFWRAVAILEDTCQLPVIATVSDGASSNRAFYRMHRMLHQSVDSDIEVVHRTINLFAPERYIWFFADVPHLMKTTRNCMYHSGSGKTRYLWNDGKDILWSHISKIVCDESNCGLKLIPKLHEEHVRLNPYSKMNVRLAVQVLSQSVSNILYGYYPTDTHGTAELCKYMDTFFDCLNVRNRVEGKHKKKEFLFPYEDENDLRFSWLLNKFLPYLKQWKASIESRQGNFLKKDKSNMFLSYQTYEGLLITVHSVIQAVQFLLKSGMKFVLTERFNQDVLEENFGRHRSVGRRNDNPSLYQFGYDSNTIRMQRSIAPVRGNTKGGHNQKRLVSWSIVDEAPLPKRNSKSDQY